MVVGGCSRTAYIPWKAPKQEATKIILNCIFLIKPQPLSLSHRISGKNVKIDLLKNICIDKYQKNKIPPFINKTPSFFYICSVSDPHWLQSRSRS
jgi:hypothetical protein